MLTIILKFTTIDLDVNVNLQILKRGAVMKKTKRYFILFLSLVLLLSTVNVFAVRHKERDIPLNGIIVNDHIVYSDVYPYIKNNRTYVPIRFIAEELGYDVKWDGASKKVTMTNGNTKVELTIGSKKMKVNGKTLALDAPAEIKDDRTFVPLRAIAESFGEKVDYSKDYKAVYIGDNPVYNKDYKVVYYYEGANPVITDYTINIVTCKIIINEGKFFDCDSIDTLLDILFADFDSYRTNGQLILGTISIYKITSNVSSSNNNATVNTNNGVRINKIEDFGSNNNSSSSTYTNNNQSFYNSNTVYKIKEEDDEEIVDIYRIGMNMETKMPVSIIYTDGTVKYVSTYEEVEAERARIKALKEARQNRYIKRADESSDDSSYWLKRNKGY